MISIEKYVRFLLLYVKMLYLILKLNRDGLIELRTPYMKIEKQTHKLNFKIY